MGKAKKSGKLQAGKAVKSGSGPAENPFDRFANARKKHEVLNRRVKGEDRNVGRARAKAVDERKKKLLNDYNASKKSSIFQDKRFGENDPTMSIEEKMFMRFQKEKSKKVRKSSLFNLDANEDEILTHKGSILGESNFADNDWVSSDDEDGGEGGGRAGTSGSLGKDFVNTLHFGGGLFEKQKAQQAATASGDIYGPASAGDGPFDSAESMRRGKLDALQEIVMKSKLHKMQRKEAKEEQEDARESLDKAFDDLVSASVLKMEPKTRKEKLEAGDSAMESNTVAAQRADQFADYDVALREMLYDSRVQATDRTKTDEEIAVEAVEKIEELERARLKRMRAAVDEEIDEEEGEEDEGEDEDGEIGGSGDTDGDRHGYAKRKASRRITDDTIEELADDEAARKKRRKLKEKQLREREREGKRGSKHAGRDDADDDDNDSDSDSDSEADASGDNEDDEDSEEGSQEDDIDDGDLEELEQEQEEEDGGVGSAMHAADEEWSDDEEEGEEAGEEEIPKSEILSNPKKANVSLEKKSKKPKYADTTGITSSSSRDAGEGVNIEMPHKIDCPRDLEAFDELIRQYVRHAEKVLPWSTSSASTSKSSFSSSSFSSSSSSSKSRDAALRAGCIDMQALIDRVLAWNSVHLPGAQGTENKGRMHNFLDVLCKHFVRIGDALSTCPIDDSAEKRLMDQLDHLARSIFKVSTDVKDVSASFWGRTLRIIHFQLQKRLRDYALGSASSCWPSLGRLLLMRQLGNVFSVTDLKHDIVLPASLLLCQTLVQCPVASVKDLASGLAVCGVLLDYTAESKRYVPEVLLFVNSVLACFLPSPAAYPPNKRNYLNTFNWRALQPLRELSSSSSSGDFCSGAVVGEKTVPSPTSIDQGQQSPKSHRIPWSSFSLSKSLASLKDSSTATILTPTAATAAAVGILSSAESIVATCSARFHDSSAYFEMFLPVLKTLMALSPQQTPVLPTSSQQQHLSLLEDLLRCASRCMSTRSVLQWRKTGVQSLVMKAPRFEVDYTFKKDNDPDRERTTLKQLNRQMKREQKAAMRELRRDSDFIDQERYRETTARNEEKREERYRNYVWMEQEQATINEQVRKGKSLLKGGGSGVAKGPAAKRRIKRK